MINEDARALLLVSIHFNQGEPYLFIEKEIVIDCIAKTARQLDEDGGILYIDGKYREDEVSGLEISGSLLLEKASIDNLWDVINKWTRLTT